MSASNRESDRYRNTPVLPQTFCVCTGLMPVLDCLGYALKVLVSLMSKSEMLLVLLVV
jgi:hypothetical protein